MLAPLTLSRQAPPENLEIIFLRNNFSNYHFIKVNKHTRTLKTGRIAPDKQKQNIEHNIMFKESEHINS